MSSPSRRAPSLFADHALAARLEQAESSHLASAREVYASKHPAASSAVLRVAGGVAAFFGAKHPLSRAVGLGMQGSVVVDDVDALEDFYRTRGMGVSLHLSAHADPSLFEALGPRRYRLVHVDTMLARRLDVEDGDLDAPEASEVEIRVADRTEATSWVRTSLAGFADAEQPPDGWEVAGEVYEACFSVPSTTYLTATIHGVPAGVAALDVQGRTAHFFATSALPTARRRGVQGALLRARIELARAAGCDLAFLRTEAGSGSQRNAERCGFRPVYGRALMNSPAADLA